MYIYILNKNYSIISTCSSQPTRAVIQNEGVSASCDISIERVFL